MNYRSDDPNFYLLLFWLLAILFFMLYRQENYLRVVLDEGAMAPTRAHSTDAGLDLYSRETKIIHGHSYESFDTGVHVELEPGTAGFLKSKSGLLSLASDSAASLHDSL